jgi:diguanylate cyclase (GGDEF)-like protein
MTSIHEAGPRPRVTFLDGALDDPSSAADELLRAGWSPRSVPELGAALDGHPGRLELLVLGFRDGVPQVSGRALSEPEASALRSRTFLATASDAGSVEAAYAAGAAHVIDRDVAPAALRVHLEQALLAGEVRRDHERMRARAQLLQSLARGGLWEMTLPESSVWCSSSAADVLGLEDKSERRSFARWMESIPSDSRRAMADWIEALSRGLPAPAFEHTRIDAAGKPRRIRHLGRATLDETGACWLITVEVDEVCCVSGEAVPSRAAADPAAVLDATRFLGCVERAIRSAGRNGQHVAVLYLDVHRIKSLTASNLSSDASELLLAAIAARVREGIRDKDVVASRGGDDDVVIARLGGDHFSVLLTELPTMQDAAKVAARILEMLAQPFQVAGRELCVPASIGIAGFPTDHHEGAELLRRAETAAYCARQDGHSSMKFYAAALDAKAFERLTLETSLRRALERRELTVFYQPRIEIRTGRVVAFEALLRWRHPDLGFVSPAQFVPLAEETGLIVPIGEWVLREACRQNREWQDEGLPPVRIAVNLSMSQFAQPNLQQVIRSALDDSRLDARWLELELTESTVMRDASSAVATLARLKSAGVHLSIDDFGTGYSSLAYLRRFPIDCLKIDQSFIRESTSNPDDAAIVTSILLMARSLKLGVVAEGVESESQLSLLRVLQCDEAQGYLFSPPVPAAEACALLEVGRLRKVA